MQHYGVRDVEKMLRLPRSTIRALASAGFVTPVRGPRNTLLFSFQDLIVLRAAQTLADAKVPAKRISRSLRQLRRQLPQTMPLSGLSISAVGEQVVVRDGAGQIERAAPAASAEQIDWFARGEALERENPKAAIEAYRKAMAAAPERVDARINLGRLLHETGHHRDAERAYREAIGACRRDPLVLFNLGVLLGDLGRQREAIEAYEAALRCDPAMADSHYNLALLYKKLGKAKEAIRHMSEYRRLMRS